MDIWDLKPGAATGGPFRPISTSGDVQISEHMPLMAKQMDKMAIIRSSERTLVPERGARLGNFGVVDINANETWVIVSEWISARVRHAII